MRLNFCFRWGACWLVGASSVYSGMLLADEVATIGSGAVRTKASQTDSDGGDLTAKRAEPKGVSTEEDGWFETETGAEEFVRSQIPKSRYPLVIDSAGVLYGAALPVMGDFGGKAERLKGKLWLVHPQVILVGYPQGGGYKISDKFATPFSEFQVKPYWSDTHFEDRSYQGKLVQVSAALYWRDPYFERSYPEEVARRGGFPPGTLIPGGFHLEVKSVTSQVDRSEGLGPGPEESRRE